MSDINGMASREREGVRPSCRVVGRDVRVCGRVRVSVRSAVHWCCNPGREGHSFMRETSEEFTPTSHSNPSAIAARSRFFPVFTYCVGVSVRTRLGASAMKVGAVPITRIRVRVLRTRCCERSYRRRPTKNRDRRTIG